MTVDRTELRGQVEAEHEKWRTEPTDLAGWAMRAEAMYGRLAALLERLDVYQEALEKIADPTGTPMADLRPADFIARAALDTEQP